MGRILDKIEERRKKASSGTTTSDGTRQPLYYSFEFFPPKTEAGLDNLVTRIDRMARRLDPLFIDVTWGSSGSTAVRSLAVASHAQRFGGVNVLLHLTCTGMTRDALLSALEQAKGSGIHNILALRGDPPRGKRAWKQGDVTGGYCNRAIDLVRLIREEYGDYFCIVVAGHPEGHPASTSIDDELMHLKEKMDAGADLIMTQFFYDCQVFLDFVKACRAAGIACPILPGIMPIQSYSSFVRMTKYCNISVPQHVMNRLEPVKDDDEAVKEIGVEIAVTMCQELLSAPVEEGGIDGIHFYTLNLERSVTRILLGMGVIDVVAGADNDKRRRGYSLSDVAPASTARPLPWRPSALDERSKEEVRPINWANRPKSYVMRTETWDEFPNVSSVDLYTVFDILSISPDTSSSGPMG
jgi:methylenetetrahydrofolate reductase (NADPH)